MWETLALMRIVFKYFVSQSQSVAGGKLAESRLQSECPECPERRWMLPFTVESSSWPAPSDLPIVPLSRRWLTLPWTVSGKSLETSPFNVWARSLALTPSGRSSVMPPFTVENASTPDHEGRPTAAVIDPFTV